jgi:hypothetical protein
MALPDELEKLARLHETGGLDQKEFELAKTKLLAPACFKGVRRQSATKMMGLPLWSIAMGPDPQKGEIRGHAKGILALGDLATGVLAVGGLARGVVALGGLAVGLMSAGGLAIGFLIALGGAAIGSVAFGGAAAGGAAIGGGAAGHYAFGGGAVGTHVVSASRCDPEAQAFFQRHFHWLPPLEGVVSQQSGTFAWGPCGKESARKRASVAAL